MRVSVRVSPRPPHREEVTVTGPTNDTNAEDTREIDGPTEDRQEASQGEVARAREAVKHDDSGGSDDNEG
jgi:hypothetical protein